MLRLANDQVELLMPAAFGPRVLHFSYLGEPNLFYESTEDNGRTGGDQWHIYGGHRLWHSPEQMGRTYGPDNNPVDVREIENGLVLTQAEEPATRLQKSLAVILEPSGSRVEVIHRIRNCGLWPVMLSAWAISAMAPGGCSIVRPRPHQAEDPCLPNLGLSFWPHTLLGDPRFICDSELIRLRQDTGIQRPFKVGLCCDARWVAYQNQGYIFIKQYGRQQDLPYPDHGSSIELYTCGQFSEIETLGPLQNLAPGAATEHRETWQIWKTAGSGTRPEDVDAETIDRLKALDR